MNRIRTTAAALVSTVALGSFAATAAPAAFANERPAACSQQQAQVDKATAKLADLTAKFAAHPTQKNLKAKKAQAKRVAHAQARLDGCEAAQSA
jgi:Skp family chaperone for outer membrane proteins